MQDKIQMTTDIIIEYENGDIVLVKRKNNPFKGYWALPGGMMDEDELIETTAIREAKEETGLDIHILELLGVYSDPQRDPRGRYISVTYIAKITGGNLESGSDAEQCIKIAPEDIRDLAFDHKKIIDDYRAHKTKTN